MSAFPISEHHAARSARPFCATTGNKPVVPTEFVSGHWCRPGVKLLREFRNDHDPTTESAALWRSIASGTRRSPEQRGFALSSCEHLASVLLTAIGCYDRPDHIGQSLVSVVTFSRLRKD